MQKLVQIGAGNIGRSFVGQIFSRAGFEVVFVDVDRTVIDALNERGRYTVEVRDRECATVLVEHVRGVDARDLKTVTEELATCRVAATAVGPTALPHVYPSIAAGLERRLALDNGPLDLIICENMRDAAHLMYEGVAEHLPPDFPLREMLGAVETSIGKMVPIMSDEDRARDPLLVYAEAFNTLICDGAAFLNSPPDVPHLDPKQNMKPYVDQKLSVHNLGHALCAYLSHLEAPDLVRTWEAIEHPAIGPAVRAGMTESTTALIAAYPEEFNEENQRELVDDLMVRFANHALGDTSSAGSEGEDQAREAVRKSCGICARGDGWRGGVRARAAPEGGDHERRASPAPAGVPGRLVLLRDRQHLAGPRARVLGADGDLLRLAPADGDLRSVGGQDLLRLRERGQRAHHQLLRSRRGELRGAGGAGQQSRRGRSPQPDAAD